MKRTALLALLLAIAACNAKPQERPRLAKAGRPAPQLSLPKLLNAPRQALGSWDELRGKVVVLEFWATWCDPCVESIPHLNGLAERFRGRPVVFIHITDESEADVLEFLRQHPVSGWVAPEAGAEVFKAFRVYGRPHTVLVDAEGTVAAFPHPADLAPETIMELLAGSYKSPAAPGAAVSTGSALAEFSISPSEDSSGSAQYGPVSLQASAMSLEYALEWLYGRVDRFDIKPAAAPAMAASYDIRFRLPDSRAAAKKDFFLGGLQAALGLKVARAEREAEVYVLKKASGGPVNVKTRREYGDARLNGAVLEVKGGGFDVLAGRLKEVLRRPVLDETREAGPFEYEFELDSGDPRIIDAQLQRQLGLRLLLLKRRITVVEVSK